jgi:hypothetical protein
VEKPGRETRPPQYLFLALGTKLEEEIFPGLKTCVLAEKSCRFTCGEKLDAFTVRQSKGFEGGETNVEVRDPKF